MPSSINSGVLVSVVVVVVEAELVELLVFSIVVVVDDDFELLVPAPSVLLGVFKTSLTVV